MKIRLQKLFVFIPAFLLLVFANSQLLAQQRAMFTQYMFNGLVINPAYSAMDEALNVTALARQQWVGFKGAPNTQTLSMHTPIRQSNTSLGFIFLRDQIGEVIAENGVLGTVANRVELGNETFLALGLNAGLSKYVGQYSLAGSTSSFDPVF
jgi:type IX secretion system PorP/SprF family membrane protein